VFVGVIRDVTERRRAETALAESEKRYRHLVELSPETVVVHSEGRVVYANEAAARLRRRGVCFIGRLIMSFAHPTNERMAERIREAWRPGRYRWRGEDRPPRRGGRVDEVTGVPTVYEGKPAIQLLARDTLRNGPRRRYAGARSASEAWRRTPRTSSQSSDLMITRYVSPLSNGFKPES